MGADVRGMRAPGIDGQRGLDVALALVQPAELDLREGELGAVPPVVAIMDVQRLEQRELLLLAAALAREAEQAEHAGRWCERHRVARPGLDVLADRRERRLA